MHASRTEHNCAINITKLNKRKILNKGSIILWNLRLNIRTETQQAVQQEKSRPLYGLGHAT